MANSARYLHPRDELIQAMERIYRYRMTTTSGGNLSIREANGDVWITPARVDKGGLTRDDIVCVHPDGSVEGTRRPSSELPIHQEIRRRRSELGGIVHAHPVALVAFSLVHQTPETRLFHQSWNVCGPVGFARYELPGSGELGNRVAETFAAGVDNAILENHGVVTAGRTLQEAFRRFETLEFAAKTIIKAKFLGTEPRYLSVAELKAEQNRHAALDTFKPDAPSSAEREARRQLAGFVRRGYRQRLFISTQGSYSARVNKDEFVITPYEVDRGTMEPDDLVLVRGGRAESGRTPSRAAGVHEAIYRRHPHVGAIVNAYPVNATAFSVTGVPFDTRTIPESYVVVRQVGRAPYGLQFTAGAELAGMISPRTPALLLENDGVLVTGGDVLEAFDRLEVLESTAEAIVNCRALGPLRALSDEVTRGLDRAFFA
jgi:L-ribulose-5-phosphate 4-epimerase